MTGPPVTAGNPYLRLGLARNPFVAEPVPGVAEGLWVPRRLPDAPDPGGRRLLQVIGEKGAGKTSLLLRWRAAAPGPYRHVPDSPARWRPPPLAPLCYWDELDRLPGPVLRVMLRRAAVRGATVAAGTHRDLSAEAARAGLAIETLVLPPLSADDVLAFAAARIAAAGLPGAEPRLTLPPALAAGIAARCGGSWRLAADDLHVWAAAAAWSARTAAG
ncbi:MAG TPA: hypothetical protein VF170_16050 [Planctomycetaceae bacterium]